MSSRAVIYLNASNGITSISSNLSINNAKYQDRGLYICNIHNEVGNDTETYTLSINYEGIPSHVYNIKHSCIVLLMRVSYSFRPDAEITDLTAEKATVNESDPVRISCESRGSPPLIITWWRAINPNQITRLSENTQIHSINSDVSSCNTTTQQSVIEIRNTRAEDGVEYICQAQNDLPSVTASKRLKVNVQSG